MCNQHACARQYTYSQWKGGGGAYRKLTNRPCAVSGLKKPTAVPSGPMDDLRESKVKLNDDDDNVRCLMWRNVA